MGKDISLILSPGKSLVDLVKAGREPEASKSILERTRHNDSLYDRFPEYIDTLVARYDFNKTSNFNTSIGFVVTNILASTRPAWYFRNRSISLFLENQELSDDRRLQAVCR